MITVRVSRWEIDNRFFLKNGNLDLWEGCSLNSGTNEGGTLE